PHIDRVAPSSGATSPQLDNSGTIAVDAHASDPSPSSGLASVDLYVKKPGASGFELAHTNSDGSSSFSYTVPTKEGKPVNGSYSFYTIAHDKAGNDEGAKSAAESSTLEDTVAPSSSATSPQVDNSHKIAVDAHASDTSPSSGLASLYLYVNKPDASGFELAHTNSDGSSSFSYTVPTKEGKPVNGSYSFYTIAHDKAGNDEGAKSAADTITLEDTVKPRSHATSPPPDNNATIAVGDNASDPTPACGLDSVELYVKDPGA